MACRNLAPGRVDSYAATPVVPCRQPIDRLRVGNFKLLPDDAAKSVALDRSARFGIPDIMLGVKLKTKAGDELKLRFEEVDVLFLIAHQLF